MVVDDERAVAKFAATRLQQIGYTTTMFVEPLVALAAFTAAPQKYDAIVTDLTMPDLTGLE
jgi:CheY-like chemotaxis protein